MIGILIWFRFECDMFYITKCKNPPHENDVLRKQFCTKTLGISVINEYD